MKRIYPSDGFVGVITNNLIIGYSRNHKYKGVVARINSAQYTVIPFDSENLNAYGGEEVYFSKKMLIEQLEDVYTFYVFESYKQLFDWLKKEEVEDELVC